MARWRLTDGHYLNVEQLPDGTNVEWEHKETSRENGRTIRKVFHVPMLLDPKDAADCNYPGEIIVAQGEGTLPNDYIFLGQPTPYMEPLDDAAQAITDACRPRWDNPIESLPANGGMNAQESAFMEQMMKAFTQAVGAQAPANQMVPKAEFDALKAQMEELRAAILNKPTDAPTSTVRRA